jgi:predicted ribosomally synthesized peptide with SipW-like signal peptide
MGKTREQKRGRKFLLTLLIVGVVGSLAGIGTFSAFSSTTDNTGNLFEAGTVYITDNDGGSSSLYNVTNQKPGDTVTSCIKVTYTGSLSATVKLYGSGVGALGPYVNLTIVEGTGGGAFGNCTGFVAGGTVFGPAALSTFPTTYGGGVSTGGTWTNPTTVTYQFTVTLADNNAANGQGSGPITTGLHSFTWEARNV